jgi:hypothetical protein
MTNHGGCGADLGSVEKFARLTLVAGRLADLERLPQDLVDLGGRNAGPRLTVEVERHIDHFLERGCVPSQTGTPRERSGAAADAFRGI